MEGYKPQGIVDYQPGLIRRYVDSGATWSMRPEDKRVYSEPGVIVVLPDPLTVNMGKGSLKRLDTMSYDYNFFHDREMDKVFVYIEPTLLCSFDDPDLKISSGAQMKLLGLGLYLPPANPFTGKSDPNCLVNAHGDKVLLNSGKNGIPFTLSISHAEALKIGKDKWCNAALGPDSAFSQRAQYEIIKRRLPDIFRSMRNAKPRSDGSFNFLVEDEGGFEPFLASMQASLTTLTTPSSDSGTSVINQCLSIQQKLDNADGNDSDSLPDLDSGSSDDSDDEPPHNIYVGSGEIPAHIRKSIPDFH